MWVRDCSTSTYEGGTSYVFAESSEGRRPIAIAAENGEVPLLYTSVLRYKDHVLPVTKDYTRSDDLMGA